MARVGCNDNKINTKGGIIMKETIQWNQWAKYDEYEKEECDIKLKTGQTVYHVYPNNGYFQRVCGGDKKKISEELVTQIRYKKYYEDKLCRGTCAIDQAF